MDLEVVDADLKLGNKVTEGSVQVTCSAAHVMGLGIDLPALVDALTITRSTLQVLSLDSLGLQMEGLCQINALILQCPNLVCVNLLGNDIGKAGWDALAECKQVRSFCGLLHPEQMLDRSEGNIDADDTYAFAKELKEWPTINSLDLHGNHICTKLGGGTSSTGLKSLLEASTCLTEMDLSGNALMAGGAQVLADVLNAQKGYPKLVVLNISKARLCDIAEAHEIDRCNTAGLQALLGALPDSLTDLHLNGNWIGSKGCSLVDQAMRGLLHKQWKPPKFVRLGLSSNCIGDGDLHASVLGSLLETIVVNHSVIHLDLSANRLGPSALGPVTKYIQSSKAVISLHLNDNPLVDQDSINGLRDLCSSDPHNLQLLDLSHCFVGVQNGAEVVAQGLSSHLADVTELNVSRNCISKGVADALIKVSKKRTISKKMKAVRLSGAKIDGGELRVFTGKLMIGDCVFLKNDIKQFTKTEQQRIRTIDLSQRQITNEVLQEILPTLQQLRLLEHLDLSSNALCDCNDTSKPQSIAGVSALARTLSKWQNMQTLNIHNSNIPLEGVTELSIERRSCKHIRSLSGFKTGSTVCNLSGVQLRKSGAEILANDVFHGAFDSCIALDLSNASLTEPESTKIAKHGLRLQGLRVLCEALEVHELPALKHLDLSRNDLKSDGIQLVMSIIRIQTLPQLTKLKLHDNGLGSNDIELVERTAEKYSSMLVQAGKAREQMLKIEVKDGSRVTAAKNNANPYAKSTYVSTSKQANKACQLPAKSDETMLLVIEQQFQSIEAKAAALQAENNQLRVTITQLESAMKTGLDQHREHLERLQSATKQKVTRMTEQIGQGLEEQHRQKFQQTAAAEDSRRKSSVEDLQSYFKEQMIQINTEIDGLFQQFQQSTEQQAATATSGGDTGADGYCSIQ